MSRRWCVLDVIEDSSYIWWAIRPSLNNPTLELRAPNSVHPPGGIRSPSLRSIARWRATSSSIAGAIRISMRSHARS